VLGDPLRAVLISTSSVEENRTCAILAIVSVVCAGGGEGGFTATLTGCTGAGCTGLVEKHMIFSFITKLVVVFVKSYSWYNEKYLLP
jgi:hypothetical protein